MYDRVKNDNQKLKIKLDAQINQSIEKRSVTPKHIKIETLQVLFYFKIEKKTAQTEYFGQNELIVQTTEKLAESTIQEIVG